MSMLADILVPAVMAGGTVTVGSEAVTRWRRRRTSRDLADAVDLINAEAWFNLIRESGGDFTILSDPALMVNVEGDRRILRRARQLAAARHPMPGRPDRVADFETRHKQIADRCANIEATLSSP